MLVSIVMYVHGHIWVRPNYPKELIQSPPLEWPHNSLVYKGYEMCTSKQFYYF